MDIYVHDERRELHVYDRESGVDFAKSVVCAQDQLEKNIYGEFCMTPEEFSFWEGVLAKQQQSEDMYYALKCDKKTDRQELENYIYEETKYITETKFIVDNEYLALTALRQAIREKNTAWLREADMPKTAANIEKE